MAFGSKALKAYDRILLRRPATALLLFVAAIAVIAFWIKDFRLEASVDNLILENDPDLRVWRTVQARYGSQNFLFLTFTPAQGELFSAQNLDTLRNLRDRIRSLPQIEAVLSVLSVPVFSSTSESLKKIAENMTTLEEAELSPRQARRAFRNHPLYEELLVSSDLRTAAVKIDLKQPEKLVELRNKRNHLLNRKYSEDESFTREERDRLEKVSTAYDGAQRRYSQQRHRAITNLRNIMAEFRDKGKLHLGGASMIANDVITFIKRDLKVFGAGMFLFLLIMLWIIFRRPRWIFLPMACCVLSVAAMMGFLGIFGWEVTVISSNFVSLQLIMTMAIAIHLTVRYTELQHANPDADRYFLSREMVRTIFVPCLYTVLTTIAGFSSLVFSGILPVINFGWMMAVGLAVSLVVTFVVFPCALCILPRTTAHQGRGWRRAVTPVLARFTERHPLPIYIGAGVLVVIIAAGIGQLRVENSFINYFDKSTEIYQGMAYIDRHLGGTTPLDILIALNNEDKGEKGQPLPASPEDTNQESPPALPPGETDDGMAGLMNQYSETPQDETYWYTPQKMQKIAQVHQYLEKLEAAGKVLSVETALQMVRRLTNDDHLDSFELAVMFKKLPANLRQQIVSPFLSPENDQARVLVRIKDSMPSLNRAALLKKIRTELTSKEEFNQDDIRLTGAMVLYNNVLHSLYRSQIQTIGFTVALLLIMFLFLLRSIRLALIALLPNLLASLIVLGIMGTAGIPLDIMTITIVAISIGIAVDNTIHYLHRFEREFADNGNYLETMHRCHRSIGQALFYIAITIIVGFIILVFSNFNPTELFGVLTATAITTAVLASLTLLPRLLLLLKPFGPERRSHETVSSDEKNALSQEHSES